MHLHAGLPGAVAQSLGQAYVSAAAIIFGITLMQIYWSIKSIPELCGLPRVERGRVWWAAFWKTTRHWQFWAGLVGVGLSTFIGNMLIGHPPWGTAIGAGVGGFISAQILIPLARPYIRALLSEK
jgi:hypothetical protein